MRIQHNITAMNSYRNFSTNNSSLSKNLEKLSSGYKINRAGDDAAGLAISEKMRAQITGLEGATKNAKDGISLIQTAEGALTEVHSMLNRMVTLTEQSANGTYDNDVDRAQLQKEVDALKTEIDRVADSTNFNGLKLLDGSLSGTKPDQESTVTGNIEGMTLDATKAKNTISLYDGTTHQAPNGTGGTIFAADVSHTGNTAADYAKALDGSTISLDLALSDGTSKSVTLNVVNNSNDSTVDFQGADGKVLGSVAYSDIGDGDEIKLALNEAFRKAIKADEDLGKNFTATIDGDKNLVLEAKNAGADGMIIKSADLTADKGTSKLETNSVADFFNASNLTDTSGTLEVKNALNVKSEKGTDAVTAFKAEDITLYNDNYVDANDGHKGNADKAVFEINGKKFAIGLANQTKDNLDADVNFISVKSTSTAQTSNTTAATGAQLTEAKGSGTQSSTDVASTGVVNLDANAMKHIASELSKALGVEVNFDNTHYKEETSSALADGAYFDNGEKLTGSLAGAGKAVPVFTIGKQLGTEGKSLTLQIGDTSDDFNKMSVQVADMHVEALGLKDIDISTQEGASEALSKIKDAVNQVSDTRGGLGALQNRLDHTINNLGVMRENIQNAESLIRDTDVAEEMMTYTKNSILNQSAQAMLAQANQLPQGVLQLLG